MSKLLLLRLIRRWRQILTIVVPLSLLPLPLYVANQEAKCAYAILVVTIFWMCEVVPLAMTSLLPVVLFPLLSIMSTESVCKNYMKETNVMLLCGIMAAIAVENCNLHRRIALRILMLVGTAPKWLMLGFMVATAFLSMWINNTASAAMMVPIVETIMDELFPQEEPVTPTPDTLAVAVITSGDSTATLVENREEETQHAALEKAMKTANDHKKVVRKCILLSIAYAANLGGTGTVTGTGPNLVLMSNINSLYGSKTGLNFASWMVFNVPSLFITIILAWVWLNINFLGIKSLFQKDKTSDPKRAKAVIRKQYKQLGSMTFHEVIILTLFLILILLWVFRDPGFIPGWKDFFPECGIKDSVPGIAIVFLMFAAPSQYSPFWRKFQDPTLDHPSPRALTWDVVQSKVPWGILLLMGGGFALADASKVSGLSNWIGLQLTALKSLDPVAIVAITSGVTALLTEVASNTATATILIPVLADMARGVQIHPLYLMLPATISCSYAFMLPIATPPNALMFTVSGMSNKDMIRPGIVMNILCVGVIVLMINTLGKAVFDMSEFPEWANHPGHLTGLNQTAGAGACFVS